MKKWKWLLVIIVGLFLIKNIIHFGIIIYQNQDFNQMFFTCVGIALIGYLYFTLSKIFLNNELF